ncbi:MAG TPA: allophanate hydrolase [Propionibacteriaceae bacterium]
MTHRVDAAYARLADGERPEAWIAIRPEVDVQAEAEAVARRVRDGSTLPLAGTLFAAKGNIDVAGLLTTAGCPAYGYTPAVSAPVVRRLVDAGAVCLGVTNLDQFATGLVGQRSPYGAVRHAQDPTLISGGSSSGSAVAVALGIVDFALGTDTAGSGRVPAAFHGLVGIKPSRGLVSTTGVVPACRSLDCVTVMSLDLELAAQAATVMTGYDQDDPWSRTPTPVPEWGRTPVVGVPSADQLGLLAPGWAAAFARAADRLTGLGARRVEIDLASFLEVARMLYQGSFVAERYTAVGAFVDAHPDEVDPVVGAIISSARHVPAHRVFADQETLRRVRRISDATFTRVDALLLPTTTQHPTQAAVAADPIAVNADLGRFTNFANLLDLAAIALPAGEVAGLPFGVQLIAPAFTDAQLVELGRRFLQP